MFAPEPCLRRRRALARRLVDALARSMAILRRLFVDELAVCKLLFDDVEFRDVVPAGSATHRFAGEHHAPHDFGGPCSITAQPASGMMNLKGQSGSASP